MALQLSDDCNKKLAEQLTAIMQEEAKCNQELADILNNKNLPENSLTVSIAVEGRRTAACFWDPYCPCMKCL